MSNESNKNKNLISIALSGGVDSTVSAFLLNKEWDRIVGASHYIWPESKCCNTTVLDRAKGICDRINAPYYKIDLIVDFAKKVVDDFTSSYINGSTPNPCVRCNERIRFSQFYNILKEKLVADGLLTKDENMYFSTGHYVQKVEIDGEFFIKKGKDPKKDQSYMLYKIPKDILPFLVFPLGGFYKSEVYEIAKKNNLPSFNTKESQDVCFVDSEYTDFIEQYTGNKELNKPGEIVDLKGTLLGKHKGYINYTIGQRLGLGLGSGPWYVCDIDPKNNRIVVCRSEELRKTELEVTELNWFKSNIEDGFVCDVKIRYNSPPSKCEIYKLSNGNVKIKLYDPKTISPGQSAVFYQGDIVLGGGVICKNI